MSADGRFVAFASSATNLVPDDTNGVWDIFVHDRATRRVERVSIASDGTEGNGAAGRPSISGDGRFVAFESAASNLVADDTNDAVDVFVHARDTGEVERVSVASDGTQANYGGRSPAISADGRFAAFTSYSTNLVPEDANTVSTEIFVFDRETSQIERVEVASDGTEPADSTGFYDPSISADGRFVAFETPQPGLADGDTSVGFLAWDVFIYDRQTGEIQWASEGTPDVGLVYSGSESISADGRYVAFKSHEPIPGPVPGGAQEVYAGGERIILYDRATAEILDEIFSIPAPGNGGTGPTAISGNGDFIAFVDYNENFVPDGVYDVDLFVYHRPSHEVVLVAKSAGVGGDAFSDDGSLLTFSSRAPDLVPDDTNGVGDVFVRKCAGQAP